MAYFFLFIYFFLLVYILIWGSFWKTFITYKSRFKRCFSLTFLSCHPPWAVVLSLFMPYPYRIWLAMLFLFSLLFFYVNGVCIRKCKGFKYLICCLVTRNIFHRDENTPWFTCCCCCDFLDVKWIYY